MKFASQPDAGLQALLLGHAPVAIGFHPGDGEGQVPHAPAPRRHADHRPDILKFGRLQNLPLSGHAHYPTGLKVWDNFPGFS